MSEVATAYALALERVRASKLGSLIVEPVDDAVTPNGPALLAVDAEEARHLLVPVGSEETVVSHRGDVLRLTERLIPGGSAVAGRYADLHCSDRGLADVFEKLVSSTLEEIRSASGISGQSALHRAVDRWRALLSSAQPAEQTVQGLFGELWVLRILAAKDPVGGFAAWTGWDSTRHDFMTPIGAVEVKTTRTSAPVTISSLFQLDPSGLAGLSLVRVEVETRPEGLSLLDLFGSLLKLGVPEMSLRSRILEVLRLHEVPAEPRYIVSNLDHWTVDDEFPSLRLSDLPARLDQRVTRLTYGLRVDDLPGASSEEGLLWERLFGAPS